MRATAAGLDPASLSAWLSRQYPEAVEGSATRVRIARAPGRANLIGEHTDYNQGLVLPVAVNLETWICYVRTDDRRVCLTLPDGTETSFSLDSIPAPAGTWADYVVGTAWAFTDIGVPLKGLRGVVSGTLPMSVGLSSSAALELASAWALAADDLAGIDPLELATTAQRAENEYVGVQCGIMDQFAVAAGRHDAALLLDCLTLQHRPVTLPLEHHALVLCDTGIARRLSQSQFNQRRAECEALLATARNAFGHVRTMRDLDDYAVKQLAPHLSETQFRRLRHVVSENRRVVATAEALEHGDWSSVGRHFKASHDSLAHLYEVSSSELDALVDCAMGIDGVVASRMTGAGFGGCTVNFVERSAVPSFSRRIRECYRERTGRHTVVYAVEPAEGAGIVQSLRDRRAGLSNRGE